MGARLDRAALNTNDESTESLEHKSAAAQHGVPSLVWREGQQRRLEMILRAAAGRERGMVLDNGCGIGAYLERLSVPAERAIGLELNHEYATAARERVHSMVSGRGEALPFPDGAFDLILSHEVLEHVDDDRAAMEEMVRALRPPGEDQHAGRLVVFVPNQGYPFETHGVFWNGSYRFGNVPFINYLPERWRSGLAPHVRAYWARDLSRLVAGLPVRLVGYSIIYGGYDNVIARWGAIGRLLRSTLQSLERTPLRAFGLSHFWVLERL